MQEPSILSMPKRILRVCPRDPAQDGVCGCELFWKRIKRSPNNTKPFVDGTGHSQKTVDAAQPSEKETKRNEGKKRQQVKKQRIKKVAKKATQVPVDYSLPSGNERLDWDTDEVRKMAGEIS